MEDLFPSTKKSSTVTFSENSNSARHNIESTTREYVDYFSTTRSYYAAYTPEPSIPVASAEPVEGNQHVYWKKNIPFLYSGLLLQHLDWPSLTVDWLTPLSSSTASSYSAQRKGLGGRLEHWVQKVLFGTHTSGEEPDYLIIAEVKFPKFCPDEFPLRCETSTGYANPKTASATQGGAASSSSPQFEIKAKLLHPGEVNKASHMPQSSFLIASQSPVGNVFLFDYAKHPSSPTSDVPQPQLVLHTGTHPNNNQYKDKQKIDLDEKDHKMSSERHKCEEGSTVNPSQLDGSHTERSPESVDGFGLSWNMQARGILAASDNNGRISVWDVNGTKFKRVVSSSSYPSAASAKSVSSGKGSVGSADGQSELLPISQWSGTAGEVSVNDVCWHPAHPDIVGSAGDDGCLKIWDSRLNHGTTERDGIITASSSEGYPFRLGKSWLHQGHDGGNGTDGGKKGIQCMCFSLHCEHIVASGGASHEVNVWDLRRVHRPLYSLQCHTDVVNRVAFAPGAACVLASASDDKLVVLWNLNKAATAPTNGNPKRPKQIDANSEKSKEVMFVHGGHQAAVTDMCWSSDPKAPWLIASTAYDNCLEAWCVSDQILMGIETG
eukprot:GHVQ01010538.1.p1 GENE.GHVQ01010538.1~~GHVQ01010538.1.p1  ORF type:complete len:606 (+),score=76.27 GHVQ01010538.1:289-2106(+)